MDFRIYMLKFWKMINMLNLILDQNWIKFDGVELSGTAPISAFNKQTTIKIFANDKYSPIIS